MPAIVSSNLPNVYWLAAVWVIGGLIALIGALCFAELTTTYPDMGGDYGYLKRSYHKRVGFAFSWAAFWVIRPGNIGTMAMIFADFATEIFPWQIPGVVLAAGSVVVMSGLNLIGVTFGKTTQNVLTTAKVLGILFIVLAAFLWGADHISETDTSLESPAVSLEAQSSEVVQTPDSTEQATSEAETSGTEPSIWSSFWLAMVFVMFTFGGWNDIAFVAREVKEPGKNLLRSLVLGTLCVLVIYLLVNFALVYGMGFERMSSLGANYQNPTSIFISEQMGHRGSLFFAALVCISCLGAINAMIFTSPRIYWATAIDYPQLGWLAGARTGMGWWRALVLQMLVTIAFIVTFSNKEGIEQITAATATYFWLFLALTVVGLMICRVRYRGKFSGYRVPLYPFTPIIFVLVCGFMVYRSWIYMMGKELWLPTLLIGVWVLMGVGLSFLLVGKSDEES